MLLGVLSDTHGDIYTTQDAVRMLQTLDVQLVIHCGDIGTASLVQLFDPWPTHFVLGNVDDAGILPGIIHDADQTCHGRFGSIELEGRRIAFLHGDDTRLLRTTIQSGSWDLICHGHTHRAEVTRPSATIVLNPGALVRTSRPSIAVVRLPSLDVTPVTL